MFRDRLEFPELLRKVAELARRFQANAVLIEDRVSGTSLIQEAKRCGIQGVIGIEPWGDKESRMMTQTPKLEAGSLILPKSASWLADFISEYLAFHRGDMTIKWTLCPSFWSGRASVIRTCSNLILAAAMTSAFHHQTTSCIGLDVAKPPTTGWWTRRGRIGSCRA